MLSTLGIRTHSCVEFLKLLANLAAKALDLSEDVDDQCHGPGDQAHELKGGQHMQEKHDVGCVEEHQDLKAEGSAGQLEDDDARSMKMRRIWALGGRSPGSLPVFLSKAM